MKKLFLMAAMVLSSVGAFAQYSAGDVTIQPKVGLNCARISHFNDSEYKAGLAIGVEGEYHVSSLFGVSAGVLYSQQGCKEKNTDIKFKADYINIPVLANFYVAKGLDLKVGLQPGFMVNAKEKGADIKNICQTFDFTVPVGISYEYMGVCLDARVNTGLTKVFKNDARADEDKSTNEVFQLTIGYKFKL